MEVRQHFVVERADDGGVHPVECHEQPGEFIGCRVRRRPCSLDLDAHRQRGESSCELLERGNREVVGRVSVGWRGVAGAHTAIQVLALGSVVAHAARLGEPVRVVECRDLGVSEVSDRASAVRAAVDGVVVLHDEHAVLGQHHVQVEHVDPGLGALAECIHGARRELVFTGGVGEHERATECQQFVDRLRCRCHRRGGSEGGGRGRGSSRCGRGGRWVVGACADKECEGEQEAGTQHACSLVGLWVLCAFVKRTFAPSGGIQLR
ncbi:unannotated protein [freshwater metagenome]|uniref:Unannotated protein n=1 Tax=freshwater metagenome TaxID=449393 RepID=A0A6J7C5H5_9ZZZZ